MARNLFGGTSVDRVFVKIGNLLGLAAPRMLPMYLAETGGDPVTDLLDKDGNPIAAVWSTLGRYPAFYGPDGVTELWVDDGDGGRELIAARVLPAAIEARDIAVAAKADAVAAAASVQHDAPTGGFGWDFGSVIVSGSEGGDDYLAMPGMVRAKSGEFVLAYRAGTAHDVASGSNPGIIRVRHSGDLTEWSDPSDAVNERAASLDLRDPLLYREPGQTRIWLSYFVIGATNGIRLAYSDDHGHTWSAPITVTTGQDGVASPLRRNADGKWRLCAYRWTGDDYESALLVADDPTGPWATQAVVYAPVDPSGVGSTEWDFIEVSPTNWVALIRSSNFTNFAVSQSTDGGNTWAAPVMIPERGGQAFNGWPCLRQFRDGRLVGFGRRSGGLAAIQLLDTAAPMTVANWQEPIYGVSGPVSPHLDTSSGGFCGQFFPVKVGEEWVGAYMAETATGVSEVRLGRMTERSIAGGRSYIATNEKIPDGSAVTWQTLPTPDRIAVRSRGGWFRIAYNIRSAQASGAVSNYQIDIRINGAIVGGPTSPLYTTIGGSSRNTTSGYYDTRESLVHLAPGLHVIDVIVRQDTTTIGRSFLERLLTVTPQG